MADSRFNDSPLADLDTSFASYVSRCKEERQRHLVNGTPDYAFDVDVSLRRTIDAIPHFHSIAQNICNTYASREIQQLNMQGIAVTPRQRPEIYEIGRDCAQRLGIAVPSIFIVNNVSMNAYTIASDDLEPVVCLTSGIVERLSLGELRTVIGHECGHIHNRHTVYTMMASLMLTDGAAGLSAISGMLATLLTGGAQLALRKWQRAAEITCDRAGVICAQRPEDALTAEAKLMYGGTLGDAQQVDLDEMLKQLEQQLSTVARFEELTADHPYGLRRIAAEKAFMESEVLYRWRPDLKKPGQATMDRQALESRCRALTSLAADDKETALEGLLGLAAIQKSYKPPQTLLSSSARVYERMCCGMFHSCDNNKHSRSS